MGRVVDCFLMNDCLPKSALKELGNSVLLEFDRRIAGIPADLCAPFHAEARQLEAELMTIYKMVVICVRAEDDLVSVSQSWAAMVQVCDAFAKRLNVLCKKHPYCGADSYYDKVLDLRNKCQRLQTMHS